MGRRRKHWIMTLVLTTGLLCAGLGAALLLQMSRMTYVQASPGRKAEKETETETETRFRTETKAAAESGAAAESVARAESEASKETETDTGKETEAAAETETAAETDTAAEAENEDMTETETETDTETEKETETETETDTESETETETETETEAKTETETEAETESGTETESETEAESETETEAKTETETEAETESGTETKTEMGTEIEPGTEPEPETQPEPEKPKPTVIERGVHYQVVGEPGAWYRDENDRLWVRGGTSLTVQPLSGSGYNKGKSLDGINEDGEISFRLKKIDADGNVKKKSAKVTEAYYVDTEAPSAAVRVSGSSQGGITYAAGASAVSIAVEPDAKSGLKSCMYKIALCAADGSVNTSLGEGAWTDCGSSASFQISREGLYRVYVKTEDHVGNVAYSGSDIICVDNTLPGISVTGVQDQTANTGEVSIRVSCSDPYYRAGSLSASITGVNQGNSPTVSATGSDRSGEWIEFHDFPNVRSYDDIYEVDVSAEDLSGNRTESQMQFSLNRYGSVYDLSPETKAVLEKYFLPSAASIVFYETNIDYVGESDIYCRRDGELCALTKGTDYQVTMEGTEDSWKKYVYTVPASYFSQEGIYELLLTSKDAADHTSDTDIQQKRVTFVLDWTAPDCMVSGIQQGGIYEKESVTVQLFPSDNMGLSDMKVYHNSALMMETAREAAAQEAVKLTLEEEDDWQTVQVWLKDQAGNEYWSREMPVYINSANLEVPAYRKLRKSAMEIATGETEEVFEMEEQTEAAEEMETETETETVAETKERGPDLLTFEEETAGSEEKDADPETPRRMAGRIFLAAGIFVFALAAVFLLIRRRKAK